MIAAAELLKRIAPILAVVLVLAFFWFMGYEYANRQAIEREAILRAATEAAVADQVRRNQDIEQKLSDATKEIDHASQTHQQEINRLGADNRRLLAGRLRQPANRCDSAMPTDPGSSASGDEGITPAWVVQQPTAERIVDRHSRADEVLEVARACQNYVKILTENVK